MPAKKQVKPHNDYVVKSVSSLIPYVNNSRTHSEEQVSQVAASIKEFGFTNPILIDEKDMIIAGHGRLAAANKLKLKEVPCIVLSGLTEAQKKAYVIADNKLALNAGWDDETLANEILHLKEIDFDIDLLGFDASEINDLINAIGFTGLPELPDGEKEPFVNMTFNLHDSQSTIVEKAIKSALGKYEDPNNGNKNANALYYICMSYVDG